MINKIKKFKVFIGSETWKYFWLSAFVGILWFSVESSFIFIMQGFLYSVGLIAKNQTILPSWYPVGLTSAVLMLVLFGVSRAAVFMLKLHFANLTQLSFTSKQRINLLTYGLKNAHLISSKEMVTIFTEVTSQSGIVIYNLSMLINTALTAALLFFTGLKLAPLEMFTGFTLLLLFLFPLKFVMMKINSYGTGLLTEWDKLNAGLLNGLKNNFFLSIYNQVDKEIEKGKDSLEIYKRHYLSFSLVSGFTSAFPLLIGVGILSVITYLSVRHFQTDSIKLVSFFYIFIRLAQAASESNATLSGLKLNMPGLKSLYSWYLKSNQDNINKLVKIKITDRNINLYINNVSFGYDEKKLLLKNLNFSIGPSEILLIKGQSGVGKSTLLTLLLGLQKPNEGEIKINSYSSNDGFFDLHEVMAYVGPEPFLINGSIRENLLYGCNEEKIQDDDLWRALQLVDLDILVSSLPLKLDEIINDIPQISTGQKQRLSFARAILRRPAFLILDEATANLDPETEKKIIYNLKPLFRCCTSVIVTHKDSFDEIATQRMLLAST